jgi:blocked-early-in-transport protein 1
MHQRKSSREPRKDTTSSSSSNNSNSMYGNRSGGGYDVEGGGLGSRRGAGRGGGGLSARDANANILEEQNNERVNELSEHVARLKGLTLDIGNEVREQNSLLDGMGDGFQNTGDMLQGSLMRIGTMLESGGAKHMCYMVLFAVSVMVFLWWLMSYKGTSGA